MQNEVLASSTCTEARGRPSELSHFGLTWVPRSKVDFWCVTFTSAERYTHQWSPIQALRLLITLQMFITRFITCTVAFRAGRYICSATRGAARWRCFRYWTNRLEWQWLLT